MKRGFLAAIGLGLLVVGCGGGEAFNNDIPNIYAGTWSGTWTDALRPDTGTIDWTITDRGIITGEVVRNSDSATGVFAGTVSRDGQISGTADFPGANDFTSMRGVITRSTTGTFGTFSYRFDGSTWTAQFTVQEDTGTTTGGTTGGSPAP